MRTVVVAGDLVLRHLPQRPSPDPLVDLLRRADVTVVNLEAPLTRSDAAADKPVTLRGDPALAAGLRDMGVDVACFANNHSLDYGVKGAEDTLEALHAADIRVAGYGRTLAAALTPVVAETAAGDVAVLAVSCALPAGFAAGATRPGIAPIRVTQSISADWYAGGEQPGSSPFVTTAAHQPDVDAVCESIATIRSHVAYVIVVIHWGVPPGWVSAAQGPLATYQRPLATALLDGGADIVVGSGPHVVQPVETIDGKLVCYSIGNFMFHDWAETSSEAMSAGITRCVMPDYAPAFEGPLFDESVLVVMDLGDPRRVDFVPTVLCAGEPHFAEGDRAGAIIERLGVG